MNMWGIKKPRRTRGIFFEPQMKRMDTDEHVGDLKPRMDSWDFFEPQMIRMSTDEDVDD